MSNDLSSQPLIERVFGPSWRTSLGGLGTTIGAIAAALYVLPESAWSDPHVYIPAILGAIAKTYKDLNTKDSRVAGTGATDDPHRVNDGGDAPREIPASIIVALLIPALFLSGCAIDPVTGKKSFSQAKLDSDIKAFQADPRVKEAERAAAVIALNFALSAAQTGLTGGNFDSAWAMSTGFNSLTAVVRTMPNTEAQTLIASTAQSFSGDPATKPLADKLAAAYTAANPQTPAERTAMLAAIASGTQTGIAQATASLP